MLALFLWNTNLVVNPSSEVAIVGGHLQAFHIIMTLSLYICPLCLPRGPGHSSAFGPLPCNLCIMQMLEAHLKPTLLDRNDATCIRPKPTTTTQGR